MCISLRHSRISRSILDQKIHTLKLLILPQQPSKKRNFQFSLLLMPFVLVFLHTGQHLLLSIWYLSMRKIRSFCFIFISLTTSDVCSHRPSALFLWNTCFFFFPSSDLRLHEHYLDFNPLWYVFFLFVAWILTLIMVVFVIQKCLKF